MIAAVTRAIAFGSASSGGASLGLAEQSGRGCGFDAVALGSTLGELVGRWSVGALPHTTEQHTVELVGEQLDDVRNLVHASGCVQASPGFQQGAPHQPARPVPTQAADVVALAMSVASFGQQLVELRSVLGRDAGTNGCDVGFGDVEMLGGAEQRRQLQRRNLGQCGPVDVVAGDRAPHVLLEPGVDGGSGVGAECSHVVDRIERRHRHPAVLDRAGHRAQHHGRLDRCR